MMSTGTAQAGKSPYEANDKELQEYLKKGAKLTADAARYIIGHISDTLHQQRSLANAVKKDYAAYVKDMLRYKDETAAYMKDILPSEEQLEKMQKATEQSRHGFESLRVEYLKKLKEAVYEGEEYWIQSREEITNNYLQAVKEMYAAEQKTKIDTWNEFSSFFTSALTDVQTKLEELKSKEPTPSNDQSLITPVLNILTGALGGVASGILEKIVTKLNFNPLEKVITSAMEVLGPLIDDILAPLSEILGVIGTTLGELIRPVLEQIAYIAQPLLDALSPIINAFAQLAPAVNSIARLLFMTDIPLQILGSALTQLGNGIVWLYNRAVVPVCNLIIKAVNGVIKAINKALGVFGVKIKELDDLKPMELSSWKETADKINKDLEKVADAVNTTKEVYNEQRKTVEDQFSSQLGTMKDLKRVGAITRAEYERQVAQTQKEYNDRISAINTEEKSQLDALEAIKKQLSDGLMVYDVSGAAASGANIKVPQGSIIESLVNSAMNTASGVVSSVTGAVSGVVNSVSKSIKKIFSDKRLKSNISSVGSTVGGLPVYKYHYSGFAQNRFGLPAGEQIGVMAQEVRRVFPHAVSYENGYMAVDYAKLAKYRPSGGKSYSDTRLKTNITRLSPVMAASSGGATVVNLHVAGSVVTEGQLVDHITRAIEINRRRGHVQGVR